MFKLGERLVKGVWILARLSLRTSEPAEARIILPPRTKDIPGYGKVSRVQMSARECSIRTLSDRLGASIVVRCVVSKD